MRTGVKSVYSRRTGQKLLNILDLKNSVNNTTKHDRNFTSTLMSVSSNTLSFMVQMCSSDKKKPRVLIWLLQQPSNPYTNTGLFFLFGVTHSLLKRNGFLPYF